MAHPGAGELAWDITRVTAYAALVPVVYVWEPSLQASVALLVGLSIAAPLEAAAQAAQRSWRRYHGATSPDVDTIEDRLTRIEEAVTRGGR